VGINFAAHCVSYEGERPFPTDGKRYRHPIQEAAQAESRLVSLAAGYYDDFLIIGFEASNDDPYAFRWRNSNDLELKYGVILAPAS